MTIMLDTLLDDALQTWQPSTLLHSGALLLPIVEKLHSKHPQLQLVDLPVGEKELLSTSLFKPSTFCVLCELLENHSKDKVLEIIARLRNGLCNPIYLLHNNAHESKANNWHPNDFFGLGFRNLGITRHQNQILNCYCYSLQKYNNRRDWNNAQYWANPENFGKHRW